MTANTKELVYTETTLRSSLKRKKSFPNFSRQKPDHSTKCAAAPGEDDPDGAEKLLFYCEVLSDKDTRMREGGQ